MQERILLRDLQPPVAHPPIQSSKPILGPIPAITSAEVAVKMKMGKRWALTTSQCKPGSYHWDVHWAITILTDLFSRIATYGEAPHAWLTSTTVNIWKGKGDVAKCPNYRPICLLCYAIKIFERVIEGWLWKKAAISPNQSQMQSMPLLERHCKKKSLYTWRSLTWRRLLTECPTTSSGTPLWLTVSLKPTWLR